MNLRRFIAIADYPSDDDDQRLRTRVGVVAGYLTIVAPLTLPVQAQRHPLSWPLAFGLSLFSIGNLVVLARSHAFDRYVLALIGAGTVFVPLATFVGGGITGSSPGLVWAFLVPAYATMALGPSRATPWYIAFLLSIGVMFVIDPLARGAIGTPPYLLRLVSQTQNVVMPLTIVFLLLRYRTSDAVRQRHGSTSCSRTPSRPPSRPASSRATNTSPTRIRRRRSCSPTSSRSPHGRHGPSRYVPSRYAMSYSAPSTTSPWPTASRRSARSGTRSWPSRGRPILGPTTPAPRSSSRSPSFDRQRCGDALTTSISSCESALPAVRSSAA